MKSSINVAGYRRIFFGGSKEERCKNADSIGPCEGVCSGRMRRNEALGSEYKNGLILRTKVMSGLIQLFA